MIKAFITDIDGTLTDAGRRLSLSAVAELRRLIDSGIPIILASGNTSCFLDTLSHMIGTDGTIIAENGGVYRKGYLGDLHIEGDHDLCYAAYQNIFRALQPKGDELRLFSYNLRHSDVAFARGTNLQTVNHIIAGMDVEAVDTGFAIHLHTPGVSKGKAFVSLARDMGLSPADFLAAGDSENDISMLAAAGKAIAPANSSECVKEAVRKKGDMGYVSTLSFGEAVTEALKETF